MADLDFSRVNMIDLDKKFPLQYVTINKIFKYIANYVEIIENVEQPVEQPVEELHGAEEAEVHTAKAMYDYTASEENEISFPDGAIITDILFVSEDWWQGKAPDGTVGLFPGKKIIIFFLQFFRNYIKFHFFLANYVELQ
jgi:hypothetical protein